MVLVQHKGITQLNKSCNPLLYNVLTINDIVARIWQKNRHEGNLPIEETTGYDPPDKSTPGVIRGRKT